MHDEELVDKYLAELRGQMLAAARFDIHIDRPAVERPAPHGMRRVEPGRVTTYHIRIEHAEQPGDRDGGE